MCDQHCGRMRAEGHAADTVAGVRTGAITTLGMPRNNAKPAASSVMRSLGQPGPCRTFRLLGPLHADLCSTRQSRSSCHQANAQLMHSCRLEAALRRGALQGDKGKLSTSSQQKAGSGCLYPGQAKQGPHSCHDCGLPTHTSVNCWIWRIGLAHVESSSQTQQSQGESVRLRALLCFHDVGCDPSQCIHMHQASALMASGLQDGHVTGARQADNVRARVTLPHRTSATDLSRTLQ